MLGIHEGGCLCGAIRYRVKGEPARSLVCHCTFCQRASGTAFQILPFFQKQDVEFSGESPATYQHRAPEHGRTLSLQFCRRCGTRVGLQAERAPDFQAICGGTFDEPNWFAVNTHIFARSAVHWMAFPPHIQCFERHRVTEEGKPETALPAQDRPWLKSDLIA